MLGPEHVIACAGSHGEMGRQQGRAAREECEQVFATFLEGPEFALTRPPLLPRAAHVALGKWRARRALQRPLAAACPEQAERLEGIAAGSGLPLGLFYMGLAAELILNRVHWVPGACSALGVRGARSSGGEPLIAKNFDYPDPYRVGFCVRRNAPSGLLRSIDVTVAPLAGCHSGVNEAGLAITYNYGYGQDEADSPVPLTLWVQTALERCRTVAEAEALFRDSARAGGAILTLADAEGDLAVFEVSPTRFAVRRSGDLTCATNHYLAPETREVDVPADAIFGAGAVPILRGQRVHASSEARFAALEAVGGGSHRFDANALEDALRDHGGREFGDDGTLCRHGPYYRSTCAVVLMPAQRALRVAFGRPCEQRFVEHAVEASSQVPSSA